MHRHKTINFRFFEKFASKKFCVSDTTFFCFITVIITLPYVLAICCYYYDESKQALAGIASELIVFLQTFNKQWPIFGKLDFISLWYAVDSLKFLSAVFILKAKTEIQCFFSCSSYMYFVVSEKLLWFCPSVANLITSHKLICQTLLAGCFVVMRIIRNDLVLKVLPSRKIFLPCHCSYSTLLVTVGCFVSGIKSFLWLTFAQFVFMSLTTHNLLSFLIPEHFFKTVPLSPSHLLTCIFIICFASSSSENLFLVSPMNDHKIQVIAALLLAWLLFKFTKLLLFSIEFDSFCITNHSRTCLKRRKSRQKCRQVKFVHTVRKNRNKNKKVVNFKKELRSLNKLEQLIDVITKDSNPGSMESNQSFTSNLVSSPIPSILSKLKHTGKNSYCCKKDMVFTKIQSLVLKLNIHILEKEKAILDKKERQSQSFSVTLMTPSDKIVVSDLKSNELFYNELI